MVTSDTWQMTGELRLVTDTIFLFLNLLHYIPLYIWFPKLYDMLGIEVVLILTISHGLDRKVFYYQTFIKKMDNILIFLCQVSKFLGKRRKKIEPTLFVKSFPLLNFTIERANLPSFQANKVELWPNWRVDPW